MSDISKIKIDNTIYQIKDAISRSGIYQEVSDWVIGSSSLDTFDKTGLYIFNNIDRGNVVNDGIPITNDGLFSARLEVLNIGNNVSQILHLHNDEGGDINIYTRFKNENTGWESWGKLQTNIEVGQVNTLDNLIDNGIYSGVLTNGTTSSLGNFYDTFVLIVINNYSVAGPLGRQRSISQLKYNLTLDGIVKIEKRVRYTNDIWSNWEIIGGNFAELEEKIETNKTDIQYLFEEAVKFDTLEVEELGDGIGINYNTFDGNSGSIEIPFATKKIGGIMSAEDKVKLDNIDSITILSTPPIDVIKEEFLNNFYPQRDDNNKLINIGNFRSYSTQGTSHLDIKVNVLAWANATQQEIFMQTVCGPITINNSDKTLVWVNGKRFSNYYRTSSRDENNNLIWSEWKIVNDFEINKKTEELVSFLSKLKTAFGTDDLDTIVSKLASLK